MTREQYAKTSSPDREIARLVSQAGDSGEPTVIAAPESSLAHTMSHIADELIRTLG